MKRSQKTRERPAQPLDARPLSWWRVTRDAATGPYTTIAEAQAAPAEGFSIIVLARSAEDAQAIRSQGSER